MSKKRQRRELRDEMRRVLHSLDPRWLKAASAEVCTNLTALLGKLRESEGREVRRILAWTRFFPGEVDLAPFIASTLRNYEIYLPRSLPDRSMTFLSIGGDWSSQAEVGPMGIPEPAVGSGVPFEPALAEETAVLVPGLAFDRLGNRLGRGKGYYDRFLGQSLLNGVVKIGICWELQVVASVPEETHDVPMDWICHEAGFEATNEPTGVLPGFGDVE